MPSIDTDIDIFVVLGKLPSDIVGLILDYLPKCMLHELLYFHLLEVVASAILSKMLISNVLQRNTDYSECNCDLWISRQKIEAGYRSMEHISQICCH